MSESLCVLGYGVFATASFGKADFLLEYPGPLLSKAEGEKLLDSYESGLGSYLFFYNNYW